MGEGAHGSLAREGGLQPWIFVQTPISYIVTPLLIGPVCLLSQLGQFEEPVRPRWHYARY